MAIRVAILFGCTHNNTCPLEANDKKILDSEKLQPLLQT